MGSLIFICLFLILVGVTFYKYKNNIGIYSLSGLIINCLMGGALLGTVICFFSSIFLSDKVIQEEKIVSSAINSKISGSFILGSGSISEKEVIVGYREVGNNSYQRAYIEFKDLTINETEELKDYAIHKYKLCNYTDWLIPINHTFECEVKTTHSISIPKGTIIKEIKL